jgi:hypothetical protein
MAKVKIQGNASGTGVITLIAPNTNTDRTVTLPDESITLGGGVDGIVSTADATAITIDSSERVIIGDLGLTPDTTADNLSIEGVGAGMSILTHNGGQGKIVFGEQADTSKAMIGFYSGGTDRLVFSGADASTEHLAITSDGRGLSQFTAKAWVNFNGTGSMRDSHNVSSVTDNSTGDFTINFSNNLANADYVPLCGQEGGFDVHRYNTHVSSSTSSYHAQVGYHSTGSTLVKADLGYNFYAFFGD